MAPIHVEEAREIDARPEAVYGVLADYQTGHPAILPRPPFTDLKVEQGGHGAGTVIRVWMKVMGTERESRMVISEPEPGRVLVETDPDAGITTHFVVEPLNGGSRSRLTIATDVNPSGGVMGLIERVTYPAYLRRVYRQELQNIADYVRNR